LDCILLEANLIGISIEDFLTQVKAVTPKIFIVAISDCDKIPEWAQRLGIVSFLKKPFVADELRRVMSACLSESGTKLMST
jgi:two-component SAPR family response regulator